MIEKKTFVTALSGVLVGGMLLSGGMAIAGDAASTVSKGVYTKMPFSDFGMGHRGERGPSMGRFGEAPGKLSQANLDQLVKEGVITQEKADKVKAYLDKTEKEKKTFGDQGIKPKGRQDLFSGLVTNNILTQSEVDTIKAKLQEFAQEKKQQQLSAALKTVIEKGIITQEQSDKILNQFEAAQKNREELSAKMDNMTLKQIRQYMQNNQGQPQNPLDQLVSDGVLTQVQVDAIQEAMRETTQKQNQQRISDGLKALVDKGTITQDQADKILTTIENNQKEREALNEKMKNMTQGERRQYMQNTKNNKPQDVISKLVEDGTITQDQAKAIEEAAPMHHGPGRGRR